MLRNLGVVLLFGFMIQLVGMQIMVPYKPSFTAKYPTLTHIGKSLLASAGACTLAIEARSFFDNLSMRDDLNALCALGLGVFGVSYLYHKKYTTRSLVDSLLTNPIEVSDNHGEIMTNFEREIEENQKRKQDSEKFLMIFNNAVKKYEKESPIFFLGECTGTNSGLPCIFSRKLNPHFRETFENIVSSRLIQCIDVSADPISYTSFGCGDALQDMVVLAGVLAQKPNATLNINLIDVQHRWFIFANEYFKAPKKITKESACFDFKRFDGDFINAVKAEANDDKKDCNTIKTELIAGYLKIERRYKQFITWLQYTFPQAKISLCIHDSANSYIDYIKQHNLAYPDVISAADIQDEISGLKEGPRSYVKLTLQVLENKPNSSNVWLAKEFIKNENTPIYVNGVKQVLSDEKVSIWSYSLNAISDSVSGTIEGKTIYCKKIHL